MFSMQINTTHMSWTTKTSSRMKHEMIVIQDKISAAPTHKILVIFVSDKMCKFVVRFVPNFHIIKRKDMWGKGEVTITNLFDFPFRIQFQDWFFLHTFKILLFLVKSYFSFGEHILGNSVFLFEVLCTSNRVHNGVFTTFSFWSDAMQYLESFKKEVFRINCQEIGGSK